MELRTVKRGFLLDAFQRGEKGSLCLLLATDGLYRMNATSANKIGGKNTTVGCLTGSLCDFDLAYKGASQEGPLMLRSVDLISPFGDFASDLSTASFFLLAKEAVEELLIDDKDDAPSLYLVYKRALEVLKETKDSLAAFTLFLAKSFEFLGIEPETGECVNCSRRDRIVSFSFDEGGFLCERCARQIGARPLPKKELLTYKYLFKTPLEDMTPEKILRPVLLAASDKMVSFLRENYGAKLDSYSLFLTSLE